MNQRVLLPFALAGLLPFVSVTAVAQDTKTLANLQDRSVQAQQSQAEAVTLQQRRANYERLLEVTTDRGKRYDILRRLAGVLLKIAARSPNQTQAAQRAMNIYQKLTAARSFPERAADLLYQTAHAADLAGNVAAGIVALTRLIRNYPNYSLIPEARFRRAELRFTYGNYREAVEDYTWLIEHAQDSRFLLQAYYKRGWAYYKLSYYTAALRDQLQVLQMLFGSNPIGEDGKPRWETLSKGQRALARDALRNMTLTFAILGEKYTPGEFVEDVGAGQFEYMLVNALVEHYLDKQRYTDAANTALAFARRNPEHPQAKRMEVRAIAALAAGGFHSAVIEAKQKYVIRYGIKQKSWYGKNPLKVPEVRQRLKKYLDAITRSLHAGAQKTGRRADYLAAAEWYSKYLKIFPHSKRATEIAFLLGEVLMEAGRYRAAAQAYTRAAYELPPGKHSADAAYAAVLAWRKVAGDNAATNEAVKSATLRFAKHYPEHPQATEALAVLAEGRYNAGQLQVARSVAKKLIAHRPRASKAELANAWRILAAVAMETGQYKHAENALRWLLENTRKHHDKYQQQLAVALYKQAEQLAQTGHDNAAAKAYLHVLEALPASATGTLGAIALYDAAAASIRANAIDQAIRLLQQFRQRYPNHKLASKATRKLATLYLKQGDKLLAARAFEQVREQASADLQTRRNAAVQAAKLYAAAGKREAALQAYRTLLREFDPGFDVTIEAQHKLIKLNAKAGNAAAADKWRKRLIATDAAAGEARTGRSRTLAARAALALAADKRRAYEQVQLTPPLAESLKVKKARMEAVLAAYEKAANYGIIGVTTEVTYRTGDLFYGFSQALLNAPIPDKLSGSERKQYKRLLRKQALPFKQKAINLHQSNVARIASNGIYNQWIKKSLAQLAKLLPVRYGKKERMADGIFHLQ